MYFGRPVIATAYSGNLDFMTDAEQLPRARTRWSEIGPGADPYPPDKQWAEPDLDQAAALMREVFENPRRRRPARAPRGAGHPPHALAGGRLRGDQAEDRA